MTLMGWLLHADKHELIWLIMNIWDPLSISLIWDLYLLLSFVNYLAKGNVL